MELEDKDTLVQTTIKLLIYHTFFVSKERKDRKRLTQETLSKRSS